MKHLFLFFTVATIFTSVCAFELPSVQLPVPARDVLFYAAKSKQLIVYSEASDGLLVLDAQGKRVGEVIPYNAASNGHLCMACSTGSEYFAITTNNRVTVYQCQPVGSRVVEIGCIILTSCISSYALVVSVSDRNTMIVHQDTKQLYVVDHSTLLDAMDHVVLITDTAPSADVLCEMPRSHGGMMWPYAVWHNPTATTFYVACEELTAAQMDAYPHFMSVFERSDAGLFVHKKSAFLGYGDAKIAKARASGLCTDSAQAYLVDGVSWMDTESRASASSIDVGLSSLEGMRSELVFRELGLARNLPQAIGIDFLMGYDFVVLTDGKIIIDRDGQSHADMITLSGLFKRGKGKTVITYADGKYHARQEKN